MTVCMYVYVARLYVTVCACMRFSARLYVTVCMHVYMCVCVCDCMYAYMCSCVCM